MWRSILIRERSQNFVDSRLPDIYAFVKRSDLISLQRGRYAVECFTPIVLLQDLLVSDGCYAVIVKFEEMRRMVQVLESVEEVATAGALMIN